MREASSTPVTAWRSPTQLEVRDPGPKEVRVEIGAAGVCHSDLSVINGTIPFPAPAVLGHEGAGVVEAVGFGGHARSRPATTWSSPPWPAAGPAGPAAPGTRPGARALGNISTPFTFKGEPASNFAAASVFSRDDRRQGGPGGPDPQGRALDLGLPHRLRRADRRGRGAQPGQGAARGRRRPSSASAASAST